MTAFLLAAHPDPRSPHRQQAVAGAHPGRGRAAAVARGVRPPDRLLLPARPAAARRLPHAVRPPSTATGSPPPRCPARPGRSRPRCCGALHRRGDRGRAADAAHRRRVPGGGRGAAARALRRARHDRRRGERDARGGRADRRGRHDRDARPGDRRRPGRHACASARAGPTSCWARTGLPASWTGSSPDGTSPRRRTCCCWRRWPGRIWCGGPTPRRCHAATSGTSSATPACCFPAA